jgi:hypothetical protein
LSTAKLPNNKFGLSLLISCPGPPNIPSAPPGATLEPLVAYTGSTSTYISINFPIINKRLTTNPISISNPNGQIMTSTHEAKLDLPTLRLAARRAHIIPALQHCSLLSVGSLCGAGYKVNFDKHTMRVLDDGACVLTGTADIHQAECGTSIASTEMHPSSIRPKPNPTNLAAPKLLPTHTQGSFYPALFTLENALNNNFLTNFPGLTVDTLRRHTPTSIPMDKGHMDQIRQNVRSTKPPRPQPKPDTDPNPSPITVKTHE